jgi:hypothetical protein
MSAERPSDEPVSKPSLLIGDESPHARQTTTGGHTVPIDDIEMYYEEYGAG